MNTNLKDNEYTLLESSDNYTFEHIFNSDLVKETGFFGTAGEAVKDSKGKITLFVDPRYHIQADKETANKNIKVVKLDMKTSIIDALKKELNDNAVLYVPSKSTRYSFCKKLDFIKVIPYETGEKDENQNNICKIPNSLCGKSSYKKLSNLLKKLRGQNYLLSDMDDISYLLNLRSYNMPNCASIKAKMLILKNDILLFSNSKLPIAGSFVKMCPYNEFETVIKNIKETVLVNENSISLHDYNLIKNPSALKMNPVQKMQSVKTKCEIEHLKDCFKKLDEAILCFKNQIKEGLSEYELKEIFEDELMKKGALCTSFKTILSIAENTSSIHYSNYDKEKILKKGDLILLDCGGYYEGGLATDITRVFLCGNYASNETREIYTAVLKAQLNVYYKNFKTGNEMDNHARKILKPYSKKGFIFPHALGHGIGISVHQSPPVITSNTKIRYDIKNNMVFTIEPGLYKEGEFGIRIENTVYFDKKRNKKISLSRFPYEENLIDRKKLTKQEIKWLDEWQNHDRNS